MPEILKIGADNSEEKILTRAAEILAGSGIIAYPTETFYGIGSGRDKPKAIEKIFAVKGRNFRNLFPSLSVKQMMYIICQGYS